MSQNSQKIDELLASGVAPLVVNYETVTHFGSEKVILRSSLTVNSLDLGVLTHDQYRFVAARTAQGADLTERHLTKLIAELPELISRRNDISVVTLPVFNKSIKSGALYKMLCDAFVANPSFPIEKLGIEVTADILFEDLDTLAPELDKIKALGIKLMLAEVGDEFCPVIRLSRVAPYAALLDPSCIPVIGTDGEEMRVGTLVNLLHGMSISVYASGLEERQLIYADRLGIDGCSTLALPDDGKGGES